MKEPLFGLFRSLVVEAGTFFLCASLLVKRFPCLKTFSVQFVIAVGEGKDGVDVHILDAQ
jgi:hypothetical protein